MAFDKSKYQDFIYDLYSQIAENWCLCMYCKIKRPDLKDSYKHWRSELETCLSNLNNKNVKNKNNKYKWTLQALKEDAEMSNADIVFKSCRVKFFHENEKGLNMPIEHQKLVCSMFANAIKEIALCISSEESVTNYTRNIFPDNY